MISEQYMYELILELLKQTSSLGGFSGAWKIIMEHKVELLNGSSGSFAAGADSLIMAALEIHKSVSINGNDIYAAMLITTQFMQ